MASSPAPSIVPQAHPARPAIDAIAKRMGRPASAVVVALAEYADQVGSMLNLQLERDLSGQERVLMATLRAGGLSASKALRITLAERHRGRSTVTHAEHVIVASTLGRGPARVLAWEPPSGSTGKPIAMSDLLPRRPDATITQLAASAIDKTGLQTIVDEHFTQAERDTFFSLTSARVPPAKAFVKTMAMHRPAKKG